MAYYPINLNISNRLCLVVGGGSVAARKVEALLLSEALVRVISPEVCGKISEFAGQGQIEWIRRDYRDSDLEGVFLVFAATNQPIVQQRIAKQAGSSGVLLNSADSPDQCDFQVPAKIRRGNLLIAVSTGGASPALSTQIKHRLYLEYGPEYGILVELLGNIRRQIVGGSRESEGNRILFHRLLDQPLAEMIRDEMWEDLRTELEMVLPDSVDCAALISRLQGLRASLDKQEPGGGVVTHDQ